MTPLRHCVFPTVFDRYIYLYIYLSRGLVLYTDLIEEELEIERQIEEIPEILRSEKERERER